MAIGEKYIVTQAGEDFCVEFKSKNPTSKRCVFNSGEVVIALDDSDFPYTARESDLIGIEVKHDFDVFSIDGGLIWALDIRTDLEQQ